jgi:hypothetical protein
VFNNSALSFVELEMKAAGIVTFGTDLVDPDFTAIAKASGLFGVRVEKASELEEALRTAFDHDGPALVDVSTARQELSLPPKLTYSEIKGFFLYATRTILSRFGVRAHRARPDQPAAAGDGVTPASDPMVQPGPERPTRRGSRLTWPLARTAIVECVVLAMACLITYWLTTALLSGVSVGRDDDLLGGMWAVLATIFVLRDSLRKSVAAAISRMAATSVSFVLCLIYLAFLPFHVWALAVLVGASALVVTLLGRPGDTVTAAITTAVIMVVSAISPQHAWQQPILRLADTVVGVAVGAIAAWTSTWVKRLSGRLAGAPVNPPGSRG